jgi:hypothetical protein
VILRLWHGGVKQYINKINKLAQIIWVAVMVFFARPLLGSCTFLNRIYHRFQVSFLGSQSHSSA